MVQTETLLYGLTFLCLMLKNCQTYLKHLAAQKPPNFWSMSDHFSVLCMTGLKWHWPTCLKNTVRDMSLQDIFLKVCLNCKFLAVLRDFFWQTIDKRLWKRVYGTFSDNNFVWMNKYITQVSWKTMKRLIMKR